MDPTLQVLNERDFNTTWYNTQHRYALIRPDVVIAVTRNMGYLHATH